MPLIFNQYQNTYRLALWSLTEPLEFFEEEVKLSSSDKIAYNNITSKYRKKEWLAVRYMLKQTLGFWPHIIYTESGKPLLKNHTRHLSISHSRSMVGILLCTNPFAGIDIEHIERNADRIAPRFLSETEKKFIEQNPGKNNTILYWCAKEAIYKAVNEQNILFSKQIAINQLNDNETLKASFSSDKKNIDFLLNFIELNGHFIVWTTGL